MNSASHSSAVAPDSNAAAPVPPPYKSHRTPCIVSAYREPYTALRRMKMIVIGSILHKYDVYSLQPLATRQAIVAQIEAAIYATAHRRARNAGIVCIWDSDEFIDIYNTQCYKTTSNLDTDIVKNEELVNQFLAGQISAQQIAGSSSQELFPEMYTDVLAKMEASRAVHQNIRTTSMYKCGKCKNSKCLVSNLYNRSLDEGVNLQVVCQVCQHRFTV